MYNIPVFKYCIGPVVSQMPQGLHRYCSNHHWNNTPEYDESLLYTVLVQSFSTIFINIILSYQCQGGIQGSSDQHLGGLLPTLPSQLFHHREAFYSFITFKLLLQYVCTYCSKSRIKCLYFWSVFIEFLWFIDGSRNNRNSRSWRSACRIQDWKVHCSRIKRRGSQ